MAALDESIVYYRPDSGAGLELNDGVSFRMLHHDGFGIGDFSHFDASMPEVDGAIWYGMKFDVKRITLEVRLIAASMAGLQNLRAMLIDYLNPKLINPYEGLVGILRLTQTNGVAVQMDCVLDEAVPMPTQQYVGRANARYLLRFRSVREPYLYYPTVQSIVITQSVGGGFRVDPFTLPLRVAASGFFSTPTVDASPSQVPVPVIIDLRGPANAPVFRNLTSGGRELSFPTAVLGIGQHLIVNTDPIQQSVQLDGVDRWDLLQVAEFWNLERGTNDLQFDIASHTVDTLVTLTWTPRFVGV